MSDNETREYLVTYTHKPTDYNPRQTMLVSARDQDEAARTWCDAMTRRGQHPYDYVTESIRPYEPGTVGTVVRG